jgi:hypothetical protein
MRHNFHDKQFSEVWQDAQHRRVEDIYLLLTRLFARRRHRERLGIGLQPFQRRSALLLYRLLKTPHAFSRTAKPGP